jgi:hypothetical protein
MSISRSALPWASGVRSRVRRRRVASMSINTSPCSGGQGQAQARAGGSNGSVGGWGSRAEQRAGRWASCPELGPAGPPKRHSEQLGVVSVQLLPLGLTIPHTLLFTTSSSIIEAAIICRQGAGRRATGGTP